MLQLPPSLGRLEWTRLNGTALVAQQNGLAGLKGTAAAAKTVVDLLIRVGI